MTHGEADEIRASPAAGANLKEALELFFESADPEEIETRLNDDIFVTRVAVAIG